MSAWGIKASGIGSVMDLLENLQVGFDGSSAMVVGPTVEYAIYHERGTSKMQARPFMGPAARRVDANTGMYVKRMAASQGISLDSEENIVRCAALAVQKEAQRLVEEKDIWEYGTLHGSISIRKQ